MSQQETQADRDVLEEITAHPEGMAEPILRSVFLGGMIPSDAAFLAAELLKMDTRLKALEGAEE